MGDQKTSRCGGEQRVDAYMNGAAGLSKAATTLGLLLAVVCVGQISASPDARELLGPRVRVDARIARPRTDTQPSADGHAEEILTLLPAAADEKSGDGEKKEKTEKDKKTKPAKKGAVLGKPATGAATGAPDASMFKPFRRSPDQAVPVPQFVSAADTLSGRAEAEAEGEGVKGGRPIHTNKFWSQLVIGDGDSPVHAMPFVVKCQKDDPTGGGYRLLVSHQYKHLGPGRLAPDGIQFYYTPFEPSIAFAVSEALTTKEVVDYDMFGAHLQLRRSKIKEGGVTFPIVQGMAYITAVYSGGDVTPRLMLLFPVVWAAQRDESGQLVAIEGMPTWPEDIDVDVSVRAADAASAEHVTTALVQLTHNQQVWKLWFIEEKQDAAPNTPFQLVYDDKSKSIQGSRSFSGTVRAALLADTPSSPELQPMPSTVQRLTVPQRERLLDKHVGVWPLGAHLDVFAPDTEEDMYGYRFRWKTGSREAGSGAERKSPQLLHMAFPHQVKSGVDASDGARVTKYVTEGPTKGSMTAVVGNEWTMRVKGVPASSIGFLPPDEHMTAEHQAEIKAIVEQDIAAYDVMLHAMLPDYYWTGKQVQKLAYLCLIATKLLGKSAAVTSGCVGKLERALGCVVNHGECEKGPPALRYDESWGGVVSSGGLSGDLDDMISTDFGNALYNDHHYHFGYFVVSAAVLAYMQPQWAANKTNKAFVETLIRDVSTSADDDPHFPPFRSFSWMDGHSWSRGIIPSNDGKDAESVSEEMNWHFGLCMWGKVMGDSALEALGTTMLHMASASIREYFLMSPDNGNHPAAFVKNRVSGILFENKVDYATWFGDNTEYIHGIQMLPVTPALPLMRTREFVYHEWTDRLSDLPILKAAEWTTWTSILMLNYATLNKADAYTVLRSVPLDTGLSRSWALYWTASRPPPPSKQPKQPQQLPALPDSAIAITSTSTSTASNQTQALPIPHEPEGVCVRYLGGIFAEDAKSGTAACCPAQCGHRGCGGRRCRRARPGKASCCPPFGAVCGAAGFAPCMM
ncbi:unnamed protein product [Vitrella brassicaformis CCMP3155]|uniref:glucan endo-1,3-beta-D-glucosidase n=2 Tax=Vitrella brassicaformis TaxID=1169539 RepID=A0A0G4GYV1_VITBC|nr:unnamed protein product [Vitrella brassicaformis CCMP3155]|eukprot:CEM36392.1 unnamed protein product [Vitrella brassicaformis CCMP3155]